MPIETMEEQFDKLGFYELEEIEKDFKLNQEIIKVRNNVKQFIRTIRLKDKEELIKEAYKSQSTDANAFEYIIKEYYSK